MAGCGAVDLLRPVAKGVAFAACGFEIEHQVLHVQTQLADRFLDGGQDSPPSLCVFYDASQRGRDRLPVFGRQLFDGLQQIRDVRRQILTAGQDIGGRLRHRASFLVGFCARKAGSRRRADRSGLGSERCKRMRRRELAGVRKSRLPA